MTETLETLLVVLDANVERMRSELRKGREQVDRFEKRTSTSLGRVDEGFARVSGGARTLAGILGISFGAAGIKNTAFLADEIDILQDRIADATRATGSFDRVWESVRGTTIDTGSAIQANIDLYQRLAQRIGDLGASEADILRLTDAITKLGIIGGSTTSEIRNGSLQLAQGLGEGTFRAQEFNSVLENMPAVMTAVSTAMGRTVPELRQLVVEGKLLSSEVFNAILSQADDIEERYTKIPPRLTRSWTAFFSAITFQLDNINSRLEVTERLARGFDNLSIMVTPESEQTIGQIKNQIAQLNDELFELAFENQAVGNRPLDSILGLIPGRLERDTRLIENQIAGLRRRRDELQQLLGERQGKASSDPVAPPLQPITENVDLSPIDIDTKPFRDIEDQLESHKNSISELEIDVLRSQGNIEGAIRRTADVQISEWEKVANETPIFAEQAAEAIVLINEKAAADIAAIEDRAARSARELANAFAVAFESRGIDALINGDIGGAIKGLGQDILALTLRMTVLRPLAESIFGAIGGGGGLFGGFFGGILPGKAGGGVTAVPTIVNETGVESLSQGKGLFIPSGPATVRSASETRRMSKTGNGLVVHVDARGSGDPAAVEAAAIRAVMAVAPTLVSTAKQNTIGDLSRPALAL